MKIEEMKKRAADHLECYAEMLSASDRDSYTFNYLKSMCAGALAVLEDLQIIDNETAEEFRKNYINRRNL